VPGADLDRQIDDLKKDISQLNAEISKYSRDLKVVFLFFLESGERYTDSRFALFFFCFLRAEWVLGAPKGVGHFGASWFSLLPLLTSSEPSVFQLILPVLYVQNINNFEANQNRTQYQMSQIKTALDTLKETQVFLLLQEPFFFKVKRLRILKVTDTHSTPFLIPTG